MTLEAIEVSGSTVFDEEDFAPVLAQYLGRQVTLEELLDLRQRLTDLYVEEGYATSAVYLPAQDLTAETIQFVAVEGKLTSIQVRGLGDSGQRYVKRRLRSRLGTPLNVPELEDELQLLLESQRIDSLTGGLESGETLGQTALVLDIEPAPRLTGSVGIDNYQSPAIGSIGGTVETAANGVLVFEDRLRAEATFTEGLGTVEVEYVAEVGPGGTTASIRYETGDSRIVESPFDDLEIEGNADTIGVELARPVIRRPDRTLTARVGFDLRESQTFLFEDEPFSFSPGPEAGESRASVLRLGLDYLQRSENSAVGAAAELRVGLPVFESTQNDGDIPDGEFTTLLAQSQLVQVLGRGERGRPTLLVARAVGQFAFDELLVIEQISVGGPETVRGYRTNQRVTDSGFYTNFELQFPVSDSFTIGPFLDIGTTWNVNSEVPAPQTLLSLGGTVTWTPFPNARFRLDGGVPLNPLDDGDTLQETGISFSVEYDF